MSVMPPLTPSSLAGAVSGAIVLVWLLRASIKHMFCAHVWTTSETVAGFGDPILHQHCLRCRAERSVYGGDTDPRRKLRVTNDS